MRGGEGVKSPPPARHFFAVDFYWFSCHVYCMTITQTVDIPVDRRLIIDVPREIPPGRTILTFTPTAAEQEKKKVPVFGCAKGQFKMAADFDEPLEDFKDYM